MTGWRVGWMVVPDHLVSTAERLAQNLYICPPAVAQTAALGAFDGTAELERNREVYGANRALLLEELPKIDQEILTLRHAEGLSNSEAAEALNVPIETTRKRYGRALRRLVEKVTAAGLEASISF